MPKSPPPPTDKTAPAKPARPVARSYKNMNFDTPPPEPPRPEPWSPPKVQANGLLDFSGRQAGADGGSGLEPYAAKQRETYLRNAAELDRALQGDNLTPQLRAYKDMRAMVAQAKTVDDKMRIVGAWRNSAVQYDYGMLRTGAGNDKHRTMVQAINGGHALCDEMAQLALHALDIKDASYVFHRSYGFDAKTGQYVQNDMGHATVIAPNGSGLSMMNVMDGKLGPASTPEQIAALVERVSRTEKLGAASGGAFQNKAGDVFLPGYSFNKDGYTADPQTGPARLSPQQAPERPSASVVKLMPGAHEQDPLYKKVIQPAMQTAGTPPPARTAAIAPKIGATAP